MNSLVTSDRVTNGAVTNGAGTAIALDPSARTSRHSRPSPSQRSPGIAMFHVKHAAAPPATAKTEK